jgi:hypothetical protein
MDSYFKMPILRVPYAVCILLDVPSFHTGSLKVFSLWPCVCVSCWKRRGEGGGGWWDGSVTVYVRDCTIQLIYKQGVTKEMLSILADQLRPRI